MGRCRAKSVEASSRNMNFLVKVLKSMCLHKIRPPHPSLKRKIWSKRNFFRSTIDPMLSSQQITSISLDVAKKVETNVENSTNRIGVISYKSDKASSSSMRQQMKSTTLKKATPSLKQINLAKRAAILVGILLASYIPFFTADAVPNVLYTILCWIRYGNGALNPIIYAFAVPGYRKAFHRILHLTGT